jgi:hypothetical protein
MAKTKKTKKTKAVPQDREANVSLVLLMPAGTTEEVLDLTSDDVYEAVLDHATTIALGTALSLDLKEPSIHLRFDILEQTDAEVYKQVARVIKVIEAQTGLSFESIRSSFEWMPTAPAALAA